MYLNCFFNVFQKCIAGAGVKILQNTGFLYKLVFIEKDPAAVLAEQSLLAYLFKTAV